MPGTILSCVVDFSNHNGVTKKVNKQVEEIDNFKLN